MGVSTSVRALGRRDLECRALLEHLRSRGLCIDVRTHLLVESFLALHGDDLDYAALRSSLSSLIAKSAEDQERFRHAFDDYRGIVERRFRDQFQSGPTPPGTDVSPGVSPPIRHATARRIVATIVVAGVVLASVLLWLSRNPSPPQQTPVGEPSTPVTQQSNPPSPPKHSETTLAAAARPIPLQSNPRFDAARTKGWRWWLIVFAPIAVAVGFVTVGGRAGSRTR